MDTAAKRYSAINLRLPFGRLLIAPDGVIGDGDRQHLVTGYAGIAWGVYIPPVTVWLRDLEFADPTFNNASLQDLEWRP